MKKRYDIVDAFIYGIKNMMRTLRELTETKEDDFDFEYGSKLAFKRMWGDPDA